MKRKSVYTAYYENYGINGENPEGDITEVQIVAGSIEKALQKLRSSLPKSLEYRILSISSDYTEVIL